MRCRLWQERIISWILVDVGGLHPLPRVAPHSDVSPLVVGISVVFTSVRTGLSLRRRGTELERLPRNYSLGIRERSFISCLISQHLPPRASNSVSCSAVGDKFRHDGNGIFLTGFKKLTPDNHFTLQLDWLK